MRATTAKERKRQFKQTKKSRKHVGKRLAEARLQAKQNNNKHYSCVDSQSSVAISLCEIASIVTPPEILSSDLLSESLSIANNRADQAPLSDSERKLLARAVIVVRQTVLDRGIQRLSRKVMAEICAANQIEVDQSLCFDQYKRTVKCIKNSKRPSQKKERAHVRTPSELYEGTDYFHRPIPVLGGNTRTHKSRQRARKIYVENRVETRFERRQHSEYNRVQLRRNNPELENAIRESFIKFPEPPHAAEAYCAQKRRVKRRGVVREVIPRKSRWGLNRVQQEANDFLNKVNAAINCEK